MKWRLFFRAALSVAFIGGLTGIYKLSAAVNATTVALSFLLVVLFVAAAWGLADSIAASFAAVLCLNYFFLPPVRTWTIAEPENWIAWFAFLVTSILASQLSARARRRAAEAVDRQQETERLYTLIRTIFLASGTTGQVAQEIAQSTARIFQIPSVLVYEKGTNAVYLGGEKQDLSIEQLSEASRAGRPIITSHGTIIPLQRGEEPIGSLAFLGTSLAEAHLQAVANIAAIALERVHSQELASRAELTRRQEEFKASLLDALAHEFKTPLTAISAAASAVAYDGSDSTFGQRDLIKIVLEETERLDLLVTETIKMAQIDAGKARLNRQCMLVKGAIDETLARLAAITEGRTIEVSAPEELWIEADKELVELVLKQFIDNALKYSPASAVVVISAVKEMNDAKICVADSGCGIDELEQERVFEKYYRGSVSSKKVKGAGVGLSVARDIVSAHGGRAWVESVPGHGSRFYFTLPLINKEAPVEGEDSGCR